MQILFSKREREQGLAKFTLMGEKQGDIKKNLRSNVFLILINERESTCDRQSLEQASSELSKKCSNEMKTKNSL